MREMPFAISASVGSPKCWVTHYGDNRTRFGHLLDKTVRPTAGSLLYDSRPGQVASESCVTKGVGSFETDHQLRPGWLLRRQVRETTAGVPRRRLVVLDCFHGSSPYLERASQLSKRVVPSLGAAPAGTSD